VSSEYKPRLTVEISQEDAFALRRHLPIGFQKVVFNLIVKDLIRVMDRFGANQIIAAFCNQDINLEKMCRLDIGGSSDNNPRAQQVDQSDDGSGSIPADPTDQEA
jgi:hypothetical protein